MNKPFLLKPSGKSFLWGGRRINDEFEKRIDKFPLAETWECSTHPDGPSYVVGGQYDGETLVEVIKKNPEYLGEKYRGVDNLPILIKLIDAKDDLSVQVHPTDEYARVNENGQLGKSEMWYILDAKKDAKIIYGLSHDVTKSEIRKSITDGTIAKHLQKISVKKGDLFFVKSGIVHAIGAGVLLAEIQENSNLTYRLYDYDRIGKDGKKRPLHVEKAFDVMDFKSSIEPKQPIRVLRYTSGAASELLCRCKHFEVYRMIMNTERRQLVHYQSDSISFRILLCVNGCGTITYANEQLIFYKGDCIFIPSNSFEMKLHGQAQFLDIRG